MYIEKFQICKADEIIPGAVIEVVGNGGLVKFPHFDICGPDIHCSVSLLYPGYIWAGSCTQNSLSLDERKILVKLLSAKSDSFSNRTNWEAACYAWNCASPKNIPEISTEFINQSNMPNYIQANIFLDNGFITKIKDDGSYKFRCKGEMFEMGF